MLYDILEDDQRRVLEQNKELDFALQLGHAGRFRVNCFYTMNGEAAVFRVIPTKIRTFQDLGLPPVLMKVSTRPRGLVLVTGPTGSGKSTTLAAMVDYVNCTRDDHILTIEDPIEFVHTNKRCVVNQREVGPNTKGFAAALRSALREDPDIILVGEMRDLETISLALTASETGHLVFGTLHTQSAPKTCDRVIDVFPPEQQKLVRMMFAESFEAIVCQNLVPRIDRPGRALAMEIMIGIAATRSLIREGKTHQLTTIIQTGQKLGMMSMDAALKDLLAQHKISEYEALQRANNPDFLMRGGIQKLEEYLAREARNMIAQNAENLGGSSTGMPPPPRPPAPRPPQGGPPQGGPGGPPRPPQVGGPPRPLPPRPPQVGAPPQDPPAAGGPARPQFPFGPKQ
jgi:twitching motility protein PilT